MSRPLGKVIVTTVPLPSRFSMVSDASCRWRSFLTTKSPAPWPSVTSPACDVSGSYRFTDNYTLTLGIDNLLDEEPPIVGNGNNEQANTWPATYDVFGRTFFIRASAEF